MGGYTQVARYLHWAVAGLIILQYVLAEWVEQAEADGAALQQLALTANHKSVGMTVLMLAILRVGWRLFHPGPAKPQAMAGWHARAATLGHLLLYALIFLIPLTGWLMSSATNYSVSWFNVFTFPDLVTADEQLKSLFQGVHEILAKTLFITAIGHMCAALWHHFKLHDDVLKNMASVGGIILGVGLLGAGLFVLNVTGADKATPQQSETPGALASIESSPGAVLESSTLRTWSVDYASSEIAFNAEQAGAEFQGLFSRWRADIQFDGEALAQSRARVEIDLNAVDTQDQERDEMLATAEWFAGRQAVFSAHHFDQVGENSYRARDATLTIGASPVAIPFEFRITRDGAQGRLVGQARLDRLALGIGTGDWLDTTWVGQFVEVAVNLNYSIAE